MYAAWHWLSICTLFAFILDSASDRDKIASKTQRIFNYWINKKIILIFVQMTGTSNKICVIQQAVNSINGEPSRVYMLDASNNHFKLPDLGPFGANGASGLAMNWGNKILNRPKRRKQFPARIEYVEMNNRFIFLQSFWLVSILFHTNVTMKAYKYWILTNK